MMFTAVLGTQQCRPGNIVLAFAGAGNVVMATAALSGAAAFVGSGLARHAASTTLPGQATVAALAKCHWNAASAIQGTSALGGRAVDDDSSACEFFGQSHIFIDPGKVQLLPFTAGIAPQFKSRLTNIRPAQQGPPLQRQSILLSVPTQNPKKTRTGGVP